MKAYTMVVYGSRFITISASLVTLGAVWWYSPAQILHRREAALVAACAEGDVKRIAGALAGGADVNGRREQGMTPLIYAARGDRPDVHGIEATEHPHAVRFLIRNEADVNAKANDGMSALAWAARSGHAGVVSVLIENGADVDARTGDGLTALKCAEMRRKEAPQFEKVIALLKKAGARE